MGNIIHNFKSGLRLAHKYMPGVRSVAIGVMTAAGSGNETPENSGISHFIEHMFFKGTNKRNAFDIAAEIDGLGAQINAYTSKQSTCFYTVSVDEHAGKCAEILSDILFSSIFDEQETEREKGVVIEEISISEDDPSDLCLEALSKAYFGSHSLGYPILGTRENVKNFTPDDIRKYIADNYKAQSTVISVAGNIKLAEAKALVEAYFEGRFSCGVRDWRDSPHSTESSYIEVIKDFEQADIGVAFPSFNFDSEFDAPLQLLNTVFGGGMSSRLFQSIREKQGLAYSVFSFPSAYVNNGYLNIYVGTNTKTAEKAVITIKDEINRLVKDGISAEEFERGRQQLKGAYILGQESSSSLMRLFGKFVLFADKEFDFDEQLAIVNKIKPSDITEVIKQTFDWSKMSAAYAGRELDFDIMKALL